MSDVQSGQAREMDGDRVADSDVGCSRQQQNEKKKKNATCMWAVSSTADFMV